MQNEVNLSIFHHKEDKDLTKQFLNSIEAKNSKVDALFDFDL